MLDIMLSTLTDPPSFGARARSLENIFGSAPSISPGSQRVRKASADGIAYIGKGLVPQAKSASAESIGNLDEALHA